MKRLTSLRTLCPPVSFVVVCAGLALALQSCSSKNNDPTPELEPGGGKEATVDDPNDIYVAGIQKNSSSVPVATYWKNGEATPLSDGQREAVAKSVYVSGSDVYVVGYTTNAAGKHVATLWKNGDAISLTDGKEQSDATSVYVSGSSVLVAGYATVDGRAMPVYWQNQAMKVLELEPKAFGGKADAITMDGSDILVAGTQQPQKALFWKNTTRTVLPADGATTFLVNGISTANHHVYVAATALIGGIFKALLWKDGVSQPLALGAGLSNANGVSAAADGVYVTGNEVEADNLVYGKVWKDGKATKLLSESNYVEGKAVAVVDGKVYVAGNKQLTGVQSRKVVMIWRDGKELKTYSDAGYDAEAYAIFVVKK